jgi:hypothetical protein
MKKFLPAFLLVILFHIPAYSQVPIIQSVINETNIDSLVYFVEELSGEVQTIIGGTPYTILSRNKYQPGNDKAADYIKQKLNSYGIPAYDQWWTGTGRNVYGVQTGTLYPNQKYIICAHYDDMPSGTTAPGADDNASGTAAVLEAARILSGYVSDYTIIYALWDEEEQGLIGSEYYAQQAYNNGDSILGVVNLDMVSWDSNSDNVAEIHVNSLSSSQNIKNEMLQVNTDYSIGLTMQVPGSPSYSSDHASFWSFNFGAILLIEDFQDFNAYYHTTNDLVQYFNNPYYLKMCKAAFGTFATLAGVYDYVPVELASFTGSVIGNAVQLQWITASELNNYGFEIERSINNDEFVTIGFVKGNGTTTETNYYSYTDKPFESANLKINYRLKQIDYDGTYSYSNVVNVEFNVPREFSLSQNYPNPFNPSTRIKYSIATDGKVTLKVYDLMGSEVATLVDEFRPSGNHEIVFDASGLTSGTYFYTLTADGFMTTKKMIVIK